ncbi:2-oxo acid dehydrogenase subunit E2, partial [Streptomyces sp. NPDC057927]
VRPGRWRGPARPAARHTRRPVRAAEPVGRRPQGRAAGGVLAPADRPELRGQSDGIAPGPAAAAGPDRPGPGRRARPGMGAAGRHAHWHRRLARARSRRADRSGAQWRLRAVFRGPRAACGRGGRGGAQHAALSAGRPASCGGVGGADGRRRAGRDRRGRKVIGDNMVKALHEQAQLSSVVEVDVTRLMRLRAQAKDSFAAREGVKLSPMPFFVKAAAQALKAHPAVNARINVDEGTITYFDTENIGIAVDSEKGLMTPVIKHAGDLNIAGIAKATAELAGKVRANKITPDELSGGTFTISNTGSRGALFDTIIVPPNQVAILGIGATVKRPAVIETEEGTVIGVRDMTYLTLSYDHRLVDGADAARYLTAVKAILEAGEFEVELGL